MKNIGWLTGFELNPWVVLIVSSIQIGRPPNILVICFIGLDLNQIILGILQWLRIEHFDHPLRNEERVMLDFTHLDVLVTAVGRTGLLQPQ